MCTLYEISLNYDSLILCFFDYVKSSFLTFAIKILDKLKDAEIIKNREESKAFFFYCLNFSPHDSFNTSF